ncbi:MAG: tetratricopeptide repeat protein [Elusimicrobiota bacterium]
MKHKIIKIIITIFILYRSYCPVFFIFATTPTTTPTTTPATTPSEQKYIDNGKKYLKEENYQASIDNFIEALIINPKNKEVQDFLNKITVQLQEKKNKFSTALKSYRSKNYETAIDCLVELLDENPKNIEAILLIKRINNDLIKIKKQKIKEEEQNRKKMVQLVKKERDGKNGKIDFSKREINKIAKNFYEKGLQYYKKDYYELAIQELDNALVWQPNNIEIKNAIEEATQKLNVVKEKQLIQQSVKKAGALYCSGDLLNSLAEWISVLEFEHNNQQAKEYIQKITAALIEKQKEQHKKQIIEKQEVLIAQLLKQGNGYFYRKEYVKAIEQWEKIFDLTPGNQRAKRKIAAAKEQIKIIVEKTFNLGLQFFKNNNYTDAIEKFNSVLQLEPNHQKATEHIAIIRTKISNIKRKLDTKKIDTKKIEQLYYKSVDYYMSGRYVKAKEILEEILSLDPNNENSNKLMNKINCILAVLQ